MSKRSGVVAFAFGVPSEITSNKTIGMIATEKARWIHAPVFTQPDVPIGDGVTVYFIEEESGEPSPTLRIAHEAVLWAQCHGIEILWVAAAHNSWGSHLNRCVRDLRYAVCEVGAQIRVEVCEDVYRHQRRQWFSEDSTQPRTQSPGKWWSRELVVRLMPMWLYKLVAS